MTATAFLQSNPELIDSLAELLSSKFDISPDLLKTITQKAVATSTRKTNILVDKTLKERLKDINERFKEGGLIGLTKDFLKSKTQAKITPAKEKAIPEFTTLTKQTPALPSIIPSGVQSLGADKSASEADRKFTEEKKEPIPILFAGITGEGERDLKDKLPGIFEGVFKKMPKEEKKSELKEKFSEGGLLSLLPKGLLGLGAGVILLLGGLGALVAGLQTEGPFKGLLKIFSKVGIQGGIKLLEKSAKTFIKSISSFVAAPGKLLKSVTKTIGKLFGKEAFKTVITATKGLKGIFGKMLGGLVKFLTPILKKVPLIGTVISWGFAYSRFKSGDVVGGIIDVLSGIASIFPGVGTAIAIGLDILNAFLDYKSGGADKKASAKKNNILWDWVKGLGSLLYKGIKYIPVIGPLIQATEDMINGKWLDATYNVIRAIPGVGIVLDVIDWFTGGNLQNTIKNQIAEKGIIGAVLDWTKELGKLIWKGIKYIPVIGPLFDMVESITKGNWFDALWNFARINPLFDPIVGIIDWLTGGNMKETAQKGIGNMSSKLLDWGKGIAKWVYEGAKKLPIIGQLIKTGEFLLKGEWAKALVAFSRVIPGIGWVMDLLGFTEEKQLAATEKGLDTIKNLWKWIKDSLWEKVTGFVGSLVDGVKDWWNNLSWDPRSWIGMGPKVPEITEPSLPAQPQAAATTTAQTSTPASISLPEPAPITTAEPIVPLANGGIVTSPTQALIGEAGPEAVLPLERMFEGNDINNKTLEDIASNTGDTNNALTNLTNAIFKLAQSFAKQQTPGNNNIIINGQQSGNIPSASQVASSNIDPIRQIRSQFAI